MKFYKIDPKNSFDIFQKIGADVSGAKIMASKAKLHMIYIKDLKVGAANILKQDALSIGADLAVPIGTILAKDPVVDAVLIGTTKHLKILSKKELGQPFGLKELGSSLSSFIKENKFETRIMGIINANDDSFFQIADFKEIVQLKKLNR